MIYALSHTGLVRAKPETKGLCPHCQSIVIAKCGEIKIWHFAHVVNQDCDLWHEGETAWHIEWKDNFPKEMIEKTIGIHRADLLTPSGFVIEFQHSPLEPKAIRAREDFYKKMIWVVDASTFADNITLYERTGAEDMPTVQFLWRWKHDFWKNARCPMFLDFTNGLPQDAASDEPRLLLLRRVGKNGFGEGVLVPKKTFIDHFLKDKPSKSLLERHSPIEITEDTFTELRRESRLSDLKRKNDYASIQPWEWAERIKA